MGRKMRQTDIKRIGEAEREIYVHRDRDRER